MAPTIFNDAPKFARLGQDENAAVGTHAILEGDRND